MRIDRISVENFIGIRSVDLALNGTVSAVFGPNGSGKSSLKDAVMFCALGETARAPKMKKKDFADLLHPNSKRGSVTLQIDGVTYSRGLPTGNFSTASFDPPNGWEYLLDPGAFLRLGLEERRKELFRVLGVAMDRGSILAKLVERGYEEPILARIRSFLREGFAIAATECQGIARERKGAWRQTTGQNWGWQIAKDWYAEVEVMPPGDLATLRNTVANLEGQLAGIDGDIGVTRQAQATAVQRAAEEREAKEQAARIRQEAERRQRRIAELREVVAGEAAAREEQQAAVEALAEAQQALVSIDLAISERRKEGTRVPEGAYLYTCAACGATATLLPCNSGFQEVEPPAPDPKMVEKKDQVEVKLANARGAVTEAETKLRGIETAHQVLDELVATQAEIPTAEDPPLGLQSGEPTWDTEPDVSLLTLEANRQKLATQLEEARTAVRQVEDHQERVAQAKQRTADAAALHAEIETWLRLAEDLGPEGIPAQLLHQAIDPINQLLEASGDALGFEGLWLTSEMELVGRPSENDPQTPRRYELLSESARWRCEAALADAVGWVMNTDGPKDSDLSLPLVLDRFDVLDGPGRGKAIRWLLSLGRQVILLGTLRNRDVPQELPQGLSVHWLQAGELMG